MNHDLDRRVLLGGLTGAAGIAALAHVSTAGPINPPAGPVAPTPGPEPRTAINSVNTPGDADSLFRIAQSGSYYLTANLVVGPGKSGIEVAASGVTIDLNGFTITVFGGIKGITASGSSIERVTVRNGRIVGGNGVLDLAGVTDAVIESIAADSGSGPGIRTGERAAVSGCTATGNTTFGITVGAGSRIDACTASNTQAGTGISAEAGSLVARCVSTGNSGRGYTLIDCCTSGCLARGNDVGYYAQGGSVTACLAAANASTGFSLSDHTSITDSVADGNGASGISAASQCTIRRNSCTNNAANTATGAGIYVASGSTLIEGNYCADNARGFRVVAGACTLINNTARLNGTNWDIAVNNRALVVAAATVPAAFIGDSGGASLGSTNPFANFTL